MKVIKSKKNYPSKSNQSNQKRPNKTANRYPFEFRLRAVRLYEQEQYSFDFISNQLGVSKSTIGKWVKRHREQGEAGLRPQRGQKRSRQISDTIKNEIIRVKKNNKLFGSKRISDFLRRICFIKASPETVRTH
ncbi:MAG: helix-turn-helix domain containing protein [Candidatus Omnitrophica bacterium]|nr:helix-turn-helix domain containing protein [Candidatus Omnitrophota bacterium]